MKKLLLWPSFLMLLIIGHLVRGQNSISVKKILSAPFPTHLTAAPTGNQVAWVFNQEGSRNIWLAKGPNFKGKALTKYQGDNGQDISNLQFTPNGKSIVYVRGGAPNRRGEIPNPQSYTEPAERAIWIISTKGNEPQKLAVGSNPLINPDGKGIAFRSSGQAWYVSFEKDAIPEKMFHIRGSAGDLVWSPDGKKLAFSSSRGDHTFVGIYNLETDEISWVDPSIDHDRNPIWSPDGSQIAFMRVPNDGNRVIFHPYRETHPWSIRVADVSTCKSREIWKAKEGEGSAFRNISANSQLFWGKGDHIVFPYEGDGWTHLYSVPANGGDAVCLTPGEFEVQFVSMTPDASEMLYSGNQDDIDRQHIWRVSVAGGGPKAVSDGNGIEWSPVMTDKKTIAFLNSGPKTPAYPARFDDAGINRSLAQGTMPSDFPESQLVQPEQVIFSAADGMQIHGQLFMPEGAKEGDNRPAVLFFHGGSRRQMLLGFHHRGYYHNAYALNQYLASQGYVVLSVNYRSGIGYGMKFREALNYGANGASEFNDVLGAGMYLQNRPEVDPKKIGLWGGSYGGYLTALGLSRASDLFAAGVDIHGVHDWNKVIKNFVPSYNPLEKARISQKAWDSSPVAFLDGWRSPVLMIHGDDDRNVPFNETVGLGESLRDRDVYFEQLIFPDEVHGFLLHKNWVAAYEATVDFFDRMLREDK